MQSLAFGYDASDRIASIANGIDPNRSQNFNYDDQSRLVGAYGTGDVENYAYDANGNRTWQSVNGVVTNFGISATSNRLASVSGGTTQSYGYDAQGNTTTVDGATTYQYNPFNRLSNANGASDYVSPEGQRLRKVSGAGTTYFAPQGGDLLAEKDSGVWVDYVWLNGRLVGRVSGGNVYAVHVDQVGRPQMVTDAAGSVVWAANNLPFDRTVALDAIGGLNVGFPGQYYDAERGTWNNGFRDYDASSGRYIESDPVGLEGGINTYVYAYNIPVHLFDSRGLAPGDCYATLDIAAANAISDINPTSVREDREYHGWLYKTNNGWYSYTKPTPGGRHFSPKGRRVVGAVGDYHTHGAESPGYIDEFFSGDDLSDRYYGDVDYLGTPSGRIWRDNGVRTEIGTRAEVGDGGPCSCAGSNGFFNEIWNEIIR